MSTLVSILFGQCEDFAAPERQRNPVVGKQLAKALGDAGKLQDRGVLLRHASGYFAVDLGSVSTTATFTLPSRISFSLALTLVWRSTGTLLANVPSGASSDPLYFINEYWP